MFKVFLMDSKNLVATFSGESEQYVLDSASEWLRDHPFHNISQWTMVDLEADYWYPLFALTSDRLVLD